MPYELGLFIGCTVFADGPHKNKKALILDRERYRYARYLSDIAGQDIQDHKGDVAQLIKKVRNWLASQSLSAFICLSAKSSNIPSETDSSISLKDGFSDI